MNISTSMRALLISQWRPANTQGILPLIHCGWHNAQANQPQVTLTNPSESVEGGGATGYSALNGVQYWSGTLEVDIWVSHETRSPERLLQEITNEVRRIVIANYLNVAGVDYISWQGGVWQTEADVKPIMERFVGELGYGYRTAP